MSFDENKTSCSICKSGMHKEVLNGINYLRCTFCNFLSAAETNVNLEHYRRKGLGLTNERIRARYSNSLDRIATMKGADFNNLCDIGAGDGSFLQAAYDVGFKNLVGIEPASESKNDKITIVSGTIECLPSVASQFMVKNISLFHVIEHFSDPMKAVELIFKTLPPGGFLIIETPDSNCYSLKITNYKHDLIYPEHVSLFNLKNLKYMLEKIGFEIISSGRRDFDPSNFSISKIITRLGFSKDHNVKDRMQFNNETLLHSNLTQQIYVVKIMRRLLVWIGMKLIHFLGREDFIWIVAKKPSTFI